jgi:hypothetical protein
MNLSLATPRRASHSRRTMFQLVAHPDHSMEEVAALSVSCERMSDRLLLRFRLEGDLDRLLLPGFTETRREDRLWRSTCFEIFLNHNVAAYREYNFAPDGRWSAYRFGSYRHARSNLPNRCIVSSGREMDFFWCDAVVIGQQVEGHRIGLSAIIENTSGFKSFWALKHPAGQADFHHEDCFALKGDDL